MIVLPQPPKCWNYKCGPLYLADEKNPYQPICKENPAMSKKELYTMKSGGARQVQDLKNSINAIHHMKRLKKEKSCDHINECRKTS
jgi:hypothetical protein